MSDTNNVENTSNLERALSGVAGKKVDAKSVIFDKAKGVWDLTTDKTKKGLKTIADLFDKKVIKNIQKLYDECSKGPVIPEWTGKIDKDDDLIIDNKEGIMNGMELKVTYKDKKGDDALYSNEELLKGDVRLAVKYIELFMLKLSKEIKSVWTSTDACTACRKTLGKENKSKTNEDKEKYNSISDWCEKTIKKVEDKKFKMDVADFLNVKLKMNEKLAKPLAKLIDSKFVFGDLDLVNLLLAESKLREEMKKYLGYVDGGNYSCLNDAEMENLELAADTCGLKSLKKAKDLIKKEKSAKNIFKKWHEQLKLTASEAENLQKDIDKLKKEAPQLSNRPKLEKLKESDKKTTSKDF